MCPFPKLFCLSFISLVFLHSTEGESHGYDGAIEGEAQLSSSSNRSSIPAVIVFGDSTVDPGNNNFIKTIFKGNFPPYGVDFPKSDPTGRFSNGRLATEFMASSLGVKTYIPPYLDHNLSLNDLMTGVSFASAGSGFDPLTSTTNIVISMSKQLEYFAEYKERLVRSIGIKRATHIIDKAVYVISCGTNDFVESRPMAKSDYDYQVYILKLCKDFLQELMGHGARKVVIAGLPPIGCLPEVITMNTGLVGLTGARNCIDSQSSVSLGYNRMLQGLLNNMRPTFRLAHLYYFDIYYSVLDLINHPKKYGFEVVDRGCCGTGLFEEGILCSSVTPICEDRSKYLFWDAIHPSQQACFFVVRASRSIIDSLLRNS